MKKNILIIILLLFLSSCAVNNKISYLKNKKLLKNHLKIWENYKIYATTNLNLSKMILIVSFSSIKKKFSMLNYIIYLLYP